MSSVDGGVCAPKGFKASGVNAAIKPKATKLDCMLIVSDVEAAVAGTFTTNQVKAAPVTWCQRVCDGGTARAVFANSGNANACTGEQGVADVTATTAHLAKGLNIQANEVLVCSTGVIGVPLPMERIGNGVDGAIAALSDNGSGDAAAAIMTTDTVPKEHAVEVALSSGAIRIGGIAKGAGMIAPNMATLLSFITTDAALSPADLQACLSSACELSFNRICVDNDMSTNDSLIILANGQSGVTIEGGSPDHAVFQEALTSLCIHLAKALVKDGEGAFKLVEVEVTGAENDADAKKIANSIAVSMLCKTAFHGEDPNWGRIACAAGYAGIDFDATKLSVSVGDVCVMHKGGKADYLEEDAAAVMKAEEFTITVNIGDGPGRAIYWTSDLSKEYISINADYRS